MIDTEALRKKVIDLAIQGKLTQQSPEDGNAEDLYTQIQEEKAKLIKEGKIKKEKQLPEISDDEIPFDIPSNWKWCRLGEVYCVLMGQSPDGMNVGIDIDGIEFHQGKIYFGEKYLNQSEQKTCELTRIADANSVLLCVRAPVGVVNITERQICIGRGLCALTAIAGMEPLYLFYYLLSCRKSFEQSGTGSTFSSITVDVVKKHIVPLPPIEEQRRIVGLLDKIFNQFTVIDNLQQEFESNREILKGKIIDAGIRGKLTEQLLEDGNAEDLYAQILEEKAKLIKEGKIKKEKPLPEISGDEVPFEIPENWKWVHLDDITTKITSGSTPTGGRKSNVYVERGNCFFREQNIYNDGIHQEGMVYITDELLNTRENSTVYAKDILLNITGGSIGRCALIHDDFDKGSINQHILIIRMVDERLRFYIHRLLCSPYAQRYIKNKSVGDKDGFSGGRCKQMLIPVPPLAEQQRIAEKIDEVLSAMSVVG